MRKVTRIQRFKGRRLNPRKPVNVHRNLNRKGRWYTVIQGGLVVGHTQFVLLRDATFHVQEAGRRLTIASGVKNVHAYVRGMVAYVGLYYWEQEAARLTRLAGYSPEEGFWVDYPGDNGTSRYPLRAARMVLLSSAGLSLDEPTCG